MAYTAIDDPTDYFRTKLYNGNNNIQNIAWDETDTSMAPNWMWIKSRTGNTVFGHVIGDTVRGSGKYQRVDTDDEEVSNNNVIRAFNSNGFEVGGATFVSEGSRTYVAWGWIANSAFSNDASSTSIGSVDSSGSVGALQGLSIIKWTGNNTGGATIAHGLGTTPNALIIKNRTDGGSSNWAVWHDKSFVNASDPNMLYLDTNAATADDTNVRHTTVTTNSTVFSVGDYNGVNGNNDDIIAYCFAEKQGYSKFGKYEGSGAEPGPFVHTGFKPAWVMLKDSASDGWGIFDSKRSPNNPVTKILQAQDAGAESTSGGADHINFYSNGFQVCTGGGNGNFINEDGNNYIYFAFAESPFVNSKGIPNNAR